MGMWQRFLEFVGIRNPFDWAPPGLGPEVPHPYYRHEALRCCKYCGGGLHHAIHRAPFDVRRTWEIEREESSKQWPDLVWRGDPLGPADLNRER